MKKKDFTLEELDYIEKYYLVMTDSELAEKLNSTTNEIKRQRYKYGYKKQRQTFHKEVPEGMKWCWYCKEFHEVDMFSKNKNKPDGLQDECRIAVKKIVMSRKKKKKSTKPDIKEKICSNCEKKLPIDLFIKNVSTQDGYSNLCKICLNENVDKKFKIKGDNK